jgi:nucleoside-diphosphate-sugar epimerase
MTARSALVTGGTGFVGSHVVERLLAEGWAVHALVRAGAKLDRLPTPRGRMKIHIAEPNVDALRAIVADARPDVVFHLASLFVSDHRPEDVARLVESNLSFGALLLEAITREGVPRLVNTGTSWQHYEGREYSPVNLYAATKQAFEALLRYYVEAHGLRAVTLELSDTYGPGDPRGKLLNLMLQAARTGVPLAASPGEQAIDLVHVDDVARAYARAAELLAAPTFQGHDSFGVCSGKATTLKDLASELAAALGVEVPVAWGARPYREREVMKPCSARARLPGWEPRIGLREGLGTLR